MQKTKRSFIALKKGFTCLAMAGVMIASSLLFCGCSVNPKEDDPTWHRGVDYSDYNGTINVGDFFIDTDDYILYQKTSSGWNTITENYGRPSASVYTHIKYSETMPDENSDMIDTAGGYIGIYTGDSFTAPTDYTAYTWHKIKGEDEPADPTIEIVDGYWYVDGESTGIKAEGKGVESISSAYEYDYVTNTEYYVFTFNYTDGTSEEKRVASPKKIAGVLYVGESVFDMCEAGEEPKLKVLVTYEDLTAEEIEVADEMFVVDDNYRKPNFQVAGNYDVKVSYRGVVTDFNIIIVDPSVRYEFTISAPKYKDMQKFSHWEDSKGNVVSEELTYTYESPIERSYNPVYVDFIEMQGVLLDNNTKYDAAAKRYDSTNDPTNGWLKMGYFTESLTKGMFVEFTIEKQSGTQQLAWGISTKEYVEAYNASPTTNGWLTNDPTNDLAKLFVAEYNIYSGTSNSSREADSWLTQVSDISQVSNGKTKFTNPSIDLKTLIENNDTIKVKYVFDDRLLMYVNGQLFTATNIPDWSIADGKEYHLSFSGSNVKMFVSDIGYDAYITNKGNYSALKSDPLTEDAFSGKTITFLGDSITYGVGVSEPRSDHRYSSVLAASLGMTEINMGISGTVMCTGGHRTSRLADIQNISYSSDYVGILLGVNDYDQCRNNASDKYYSLGEFGSKDTTTIYGALDKMCSDLVNRFRETDTKIFMMTPVVTSWNSSIGVRYWDNNKVNACGYSLRDLCDAIEEVATYYGIVTLDLNELCEMSASDFSDGLHPNDAGAQKMANTVKEFLLANYSFE